MGFAAVMLDMARQKRVSRVGGVSWEKKSKEAASILSPCRRAGDSGAADGKADKAQMHRRRMISLIAQHTQLAHEDDRATGRFRSIACRTLGARVLPLSLKIPKGWLDKLRSCVRKGNDSANTCLWRRRCVSALYR